MYELSKKIEKIKGYIDNIISVIKEYKPSAEIKSTKDLFRVADEMRQLLIDIKGNIQYVDDVIDSECYCIMQVSVVVGDTKTSFHLNNLKSSDTITVSTSGSGTDIYNSIDKKITITNRLVDIANQRNDEEWTPFNITIRSKKDFNIQITDSDIIALKASGINSLDEFAYSNAFENNKKLRTVVLKNVNTKVMTGTFRNCSNLVYFEGDLSEVLNLTSLFENCTSLQRCKLKLRNTLAEENDETITDDMFRNCTSLELLELDFEDVDLTTYKLPHLDLSDCRITKDSLVKLINSLPARTVANTNDYTRITTNVEFSNAQLNSFKNRGYQIIVDTTKVSTLSEDIKEEE